jgi:nucleoside-diphosphate-sugar epimerase
MNHIVIGANGGIGHAIVEALAQKQLPTLAISRSPAARKLLNVAYAQADVLQVEILKNLIGDGSIVYYTANAAYHRWEQDLDPMLEATLRACRGRGIRFVYIDNLYAYGGDEKILTENLSYRATTRKGRLRARLADKVMHEHNSRTMSVTIARASDIYGPAVKTATLGDYVVNNLLKSGKTSVPVKVTTPHVFNFVNDLAINIVTLSQSETAYGEVWHMPASKPISIQDWGQLFVTEIGKPGGIVAMPGFVKKLLGMFIPPLREYEEMQYEYEQVYELNADKFCKTFPYVVTPHADAIKQTVDWYRSMSAPTGQRVAAAGAQS